MLVLNTQRIFHFITIYADSRELQNWFAFATGNVDADDDDGLEWPLAMASGGWCGGGWRTGTGTGRDIAKMSTLNWLAHYFELMKILCSARENAFQSEAAIVEMDKTSCTSSSSTPTHNHYPRYVISMDRWMDDDVMWSRQANTCGGGAMDLDHHHHRLIGIGKQTGTLCNRLL